MNKAKAYAQEAQSGTARPEWRPENRPDIGRPTVAWVNKAGDLVLVGLALNEADVLSLRKWLDHWFNPPTIPQGPTDGINAIFGSCPDLFEDEDDIK